eukprot:jgi/Galph1/44/GphlegSOOS_G4826.1
MEHFAVLYTKQKTQKHKKWLDGSIQVENYEEKFSSKCRIKLFDIEKRLLLNTSHPTPLVPDDEVEIDHYLLQVLGPIAVEDSRPSIDGEKQAFLDEKTFSQSFVGTKKRKRCLAKEVGPVETSMETRDSEQDEDQFVFPGRSDEEILRLLSTA